MTEHLQVQSSQTPQSNERDLDEASKKRSQVAISTPSKPDVAEVHQKPSLSSLPDDVIANIISFLPSFSYHLSHRSLRIAYSTLSLTCLNPRYADLFAGSFKHVECLTHPSYSISTFPACVRSPPHLNKPFFGFLLRQCPNLIKFRAPCVSGLLQYVGKGIQELSFVDTGLTDADLRFLSTARLKFVCVINPSSRLLVALCRVRTLEALELHQVHELSDLIDFLSCTTATHVLLSFDSPFLADPVLAVFQTLTRFASFTFSCTRHYLWTLPYLRRLAMTVGDVTMIIEGFKIFVRPPNPNEMSSTTWDNTIRSQLLFGKDLSFDAFYTWPTDVQLLRLDIGHLLNALRQGVDVVRLNMMFSDYLDREEVQGVPVELRLNCFTSELPLLRDAWDIINGPASQVVRTLKISYIYLLFAGQREDVGAYKSIACLFRDCEFLTAIQICAESADSTPFPLSKASLLSPRFIMGLVTFLRMATKRQQLQLRTVILEEAGELVLQRTGVRLLSDEKTVKRLIHSVIAWVKDLEEEKDLELGTIVGQLQYWASRKLRTVDRNELDDVRAIRHLPLRQCSDVDSDIEFDSDVDDDFLW